MARLQRERRIALIHVNRHLSKPRSIHTIRAWCRRGILDRTGRTFIYLEHYREGQSFVTSVEALHRFLERIT